MTDKYYLCDAAYAHIRGFMALYRNVRYWLGDFRRRRALNNKEKFGMELSQKQMKSCYDNLKAKYIGLAYLKNKTGNLYNPQTNMFNLTTKEWDDFKKVCMKKYNILILFISKNLCFLC